MHFRDFARSGAAAASSRAATPGAEGVGSEVHFWCIVAARDCAGVEGIYSLLNPCAFSS